jgi:hypothetical protein
MLSRSGLKIVVRRGERRLSVAIAMLVFGGLVGSGLVNVWIEAPGLGAWCAVCRWR